MTSNFSWWSPRSWIIPRIFPSISFLRRVRPPCRRPGRLAPASPAFGRVDAREEDEARLLSPSDGLVVLPPYPRGFARHLAPQDHDPIRPLDGAENAVLDALPGARVVHRAVDFDAELGEVVPKDL